MSETLDPTRELVQIEIDGVELEAAKGSMIIEAADAAGITIPRFCYHRKLSVAANCRMCLVDVEKAPKPLPACATPVMPGMKVYTRSRRAISAQQNVMEFLLVNHPLDCPICDQGGECELQDVSMGFGRSISRFTERKRVVKDENLGSLISTDMTRCIHCTRCVRFLEEIAGTSELGGMGRGEATMISTFIGRSVDSELSGNIIDLCPVGALTNKPYRFTARAWELRARPSVAPHDAVGSNLFYHLRRGRIMRAVPRDNEAVNETWLPDRDRWGFHGLHADDRATVPLLRGDDGELREAGWDEAIARAVEILSAAPGEELGFLLSPRATNEELYLAQKLARGLGCENVDHRLRQLDFSGDAEHPGPLMDIPLAALAGCDAVLLVGANPRQDQPIVGHKLRQAQRRGARVAAINPRAYGLHFDLAAEILAPPSRLPGALAEVARAAGVEGLDAPAGAPGAAAVAAMLAEAERPVVILGNQAAGHPGAALLRALASRLAQAVGAGLCELPDAANAVGAWRLGALPHRGPGGERRETPGLDLRRMLEAPRGAYLLHDFEPDRDSVHGACLTRALEAARVVALGAFATPAMRAVADVLLPLAPAPECGGSFTNLDGLVQRFEGAGQAPGDARDGWKILRVLGHALGVPGFGYTRIQQVQDEFAEALALPVTRTAPGPVPALPGSEPAAGGLELLAEFPIYAADALVRRSAPLQRTVHGEAAALGLGAADARRLGLAAGAPVAFHLGEARHELPVKLLEGLPAGVARLPLGTASFDLGAGAFALAGQGGGDG